MDMKELVGKYIELRDRKAKIKAEYVDKIAQIDVVLDKIEAALLQSFVESGVESVRTDSGTAYRSTRSSATVADWDSFLSYVRTNEAWELLEHRCGKKAVEQYKAANEDLPPGVNYSEEVVINIRRS